MKAEVILNEAGEGFLVLDTEGLSEEVIQNIILSIEEGNLRWVMHDDFAVTIEDVSYCVNLGYN